jgi:3D (Asp-Asp-Asp) domain-containing protein
MVISLKCSEEGRNLLVCLILTGILIGFLPVFGPKSQGLDPVLASESLNRLATIEGNSLLPIADFSGPEPQLAQKMKVVVTAYSSTPWETDSNPFLTAAGTKVKEGIVANNLLAFGTKVRMPEIFGDKVFVVEDRMNSKKGYYHVDIWFPSYWEAVNFGAKTTYLEILEN